ncbi:MAG: hypothetical protein LBR88_00980 [Zoogloeaceae bacterium]|jgi:hypothetical protein|nr:hypothetical protein [Zoogloeaceae bacterium]
MIIRFDTHIMPEMAACFFFFSVQHPTVWGFAKTHIDKVPDREYNNKRLTGGSGMDFMTAKETSEQWGISQRRVAILCSENRIDEAEYSDKA